MSPSRGHGADIPEGLLPARNTRRRVRGHPGPGQKPLTGSAVPILSPLSKQRGSCCDFSFMSFFLVEIFQLPLRHQTAVWKSRRLGERERHVLLPLMSGREPCVRGPGTGIRPMHCASRPRPSSRVSLSCSVFSEKPHVLRGAISSRSQDGAAPEGPGAETQCTWPLRLISGRQARSSPGLLARAGSSAAVLPSATGGGSGRGCACHPPSHCSGLSTTSALAASLTVTQVRRATIGREKL